MSNYLKMIINENENNISTQNNINNNDNSLLKRTPISQNIVEIKQI